MKQTVISIISAFLFSVFSMPGLASADSVLYIPERIQEHSQWCWAGSSQAVLEHYGTRVEQCVIANYAWGRSDCCGNTDFDWANTDCNYWNYMWGDSANGTPNGGLQGILTHWGVNSTVVGTYLSKSVSVAEIDAGRPFVFRFGWYYGGGHFLVGYGYDQSGDYLDYMDPWLGNGYTKSLYSWVVHAEYDHDWTHTLQITTNPVPACPENPVMIGTTNYPSIYEAYSSATSGQSIKSKAMIFTETLNLASAINVTLKGGYNCAYSSNTGFTTIASLTINGGKVTVENIKIK
jgi:hypothetical protein